MSNFDPFYSSDYRKTINEELNMDAQPELVKKTESQFLSQIFSYSFGVPIKQVAESSEHTELSVQQQGENQMHKINENSESPCESDSSKKSTSKNSPFHNFQKHLVITLRQILTFKCVSEKSGLQYEVATKIFEFFKKSPKTSRLFLEQVYGLTEVSDSHQKLEQKDYIRNGQLKWLLDNYQNETIIKGQQILREYTKLQLEQSNLQECLNHRKIQKKDEFIEYINLFKTELTNGKQRKKTYKMLAKRFASKKFGTHEDSSDRSL